MSRKGLWTGALVALILVVVIGSLVAGAATWAVESDGPFMGVVGIALAFWLGGSTLFEVGDRIHLFN